MSMVRPTPRPDARRRRLRASEERAGDHRRHRQGDASARARWSTGTGLIGDYDLIRDDIEAVFPIFDGYNARIKVPGGFHLTRWRASASGRRPPARNQLPHVYRTKLGEDPPARPEPDMLWLTTIRSHDQYNTTLYSLSDRYRGVYGQRDGDLPQRGGDGEARARRPATGSTSSPLSDDGLERAVPAGVQGRALHVPGWELRRLPAPGGQPAGPALRATIPRASPPPRRACRSASSRRQAEQGAH